MKTTQFQTNSRLWLRIAFVLFLLSFCFTRIDIKSDSNPPVVWFWGVVVAVFQGDFREAFGLSVILILFACFSVVVSLVFAWLIQCVVVIIQTRRQRNPNKCA